MDEDPRRYPLIRGKRPLPRRKRARARVAGWFAARRRRFVTVALLAAVCAAGGWALHWVRRPDPRRELVLSLALIRAGNYSAARNHALAAAKGDPAWGLADAVLARADLLLGDGAAADGALTRARAAEFDMARAHQLSAEAALLGGDSDRALFEAARAGPAFQAYAARVTGRALALAMRGDVAGGRAALERVVARWPGDAAAWADLGRLRFEAGDVLGADQAARRAVALDPANLAALVLEGEVVRSRYGPVASLPWFAAALKRDAYYVPALIEQAATLGDTGRYAEMLAATRRALAARRGEPRALYLEAVLAARAGRRDLARALLARTRGALAGAPGVLLLGGALDEADGRHEEAIRQWRELVWRQPMNISARRLLGAALLRSGDARGALDVLRPVALRADADAYTLTLVGRAFEATGERDWAARFLDRAAAGPAPGSAPFGSDEALAAIAQAAAEHPGEPGRAVELIRALLAAGQGNAALARAKALAEAGPGAAQAWLALGDVQAALNRPADAATAYARAADLRFDEPVMLRLVDTLARTGARVKAAEALALFVAQNPRDAAAERTVATLRLRAGDAAGAIPVLEELRAREGSRDTALLGALSAAYLASGDAARARAYAKAAYRLQPMNGAAAEVYGRALQLFRDEARASQLLAKAARLTGAPPAGLRQGR